MEYEEARVKRHHAGLEVDTNKSTEGMEHDTRRVLATLRRVLVSTKQIANKGDNVSSNIHYSVKINGVL